MPLKSVLALALSAATLGLLWYLFLRPDMATSPVVTTTEDYPVRDWNTDQFETLNMSLFTFSDNNRNGRYDQGDRPMASIVVRLTRPDGSVVTARSNINGFANFTMLFESADADISRADADYQFVVSVPPLWQISTANAQQVVRFARLPGSFAGLIAEKPPAVAGLMPELLISGRIASDRQPVVNAVGPGGERQAVTLDGNNEFAFVGQPGEWLLEVSDTATGVARQRPFRVANAPVRLSTIDMARSSPEPLPFPLVEDFEGLQRSSLEKLPGGRSGLGWDFLVAVDNQTYGGPGYANGLQSGKMVAYNSSGHPVTVTPGAGEAGFDFVGAYFTVAWPAAHGERLLVQAWRQGQLAGREELTLSYLGPVWLQADYQQIDRLELSSAHYWQFVVDDMAFRVAADPTARDPR